MKERKKQLEILKNIYYKCKKSWLGTPLSLYQIWKTEKHVNYFLFLKHFIDSI